ncbi:eCIS core domain-containing protein [Streptomyces sp. NBC_00388]|uniref:eCIS core domain-containing protein n=1 Tax=Streptomyces sp. NBC_00388 TaxID=2975735 RepID=UPI002E20B671
MHARDTARTPDGAKTDRTPARAPGGRAPAPSSGGSSSPPALSALQRTAGNAAVVQLLRRNGQTGQAGAQEQHRHGGGCAHPPSGQATVQRSAAVHEVLRSGGRPLDDAVRTDMEARLGADFSDVRLHTGHAA